MFCWEMKEVVDNKILLLIFQVFVFHFTVVIVYMYSVQYKRFEKR